MYHVFKMFQRLADAHLKIKLMKSFSTKKETHLVSHVLSPGGIHVESAKTALIRDASVLFSKKELRSFLRLCSDYRRFMKGFAKIAETPHVATTAKGKFVSNKKINDAFLCLRKSFVTPQSSHIHNLTNPLLWKRMHRLQLLGLYCLKRTKMGRYTHFNLPVGS